MQEFPHRYQVTATAGPEENVTLESPGIEDLPSAAPAEFGGPSHASRKRIGNRYFGSVDRSDCAARAGKVTLVDAVMVAAVGRFLPKPNVVTG